jgi:hypothetical protein
MRATETNFRSMACTRKRQRIALDALASNRARRLAA